MSQLIQNKPDSYDLLRFLSTRREEDFMSLFAGTGYACEKEVLVYQTLRAMVFNYNNSGNFTSLVNIDRSKWSTKNYATAFDWLVEQDYISVSGDRCEVTTRLIGKLFDLFYSQITDYRKKVIMDNPDNITALSSEINGIYPN